MMAPYLSLKALQFCRKHPERQPLSWLTDDAIEDYLHKHNITVKKAVEEKE